MREDVRHTLKKFTKAIDNFNAPASPQQQLQYAFSDISGLYEVNLPPEILADFEWIQGRLTRIKGAPDEGDVPATLAQMSKDDAEEVIDRFRKIFHVLETLEAADRD